MVWFSNKVAQLALGPPPQFQKIVKTLSRKYEGSGFSISLVELEVVDAGIRALLVS